MPFSPPPNIPKSYALAESSTSTSTLQKLYHAFLISVPIFFILFLFYLCYLRSRRVDWHSNRMRTFLQDNNDISMAEMGLSKELKGMLPVIIYEKNSSVRDTQCSVCLVDYKADDKLQQIPECGHVFHMDCIDHWLSTHATCPLCRLSLLSPPMAENTHGITSYDQLRSQACEAAGCSDLSNVEDEATPQNSHREEGDSSVTGSGIEKHHCRRGISRQLFKE